MDFIPNLDTCPDDVYNTFTGFATPIMIVSIMNKSQKLLIYLNTILADW